MKAVAFLQNAWSPMYAGDAWPRDLWLRALRRSRSGQRLAVLEAACPGITFWYDNTTPIVGETADSVVPADPAHIRRVLEEQSPDVVLALGRQAALAVRPLVQVPLLILPHPAHRFLTDALYRGAGQVLRVGFTSVIELHQDRGAVRVIS